MSDFPVDRSLIEEHGFAHLPDFGHRYQISTPSDLADVLDSWPVEWRGYTLGQSRRRLLCRQVYTASEYNPSRRLYTHHELSYTPCAPRWIVFYAHQPATAGTVTLLDGYTVADSIIQSQWASLLDEAIVYRKCMPSVQRFGFGKTWQEHFEVSQNNPLGRSRIELMLFDQGASCRWLANGDLSIEFIRPMCIQQENRACWFAQPRLWHLPFQGIQWFEQSMDSIQWPTAVTLMSGGVFPAAFLRCITDIETQRSMQIQLGEGGLLIVDNHRFAHGRTPYSGKREHWVAMGDTSLLD